MTHSHDDGEPIRGDETVHDSHATVHDSHETVEYRTTPAALIERGVVFIFGLIQVVLLLRIVLLLLAAREGNAIVAFIYEVSDVLVAPFRGILAMEQVGAGETALDVAAIVALVGWTIIELLVLATVRLVRR